MDKNNIANAFLAALSNAIVHDLGAKLGLPKQELTRIAEFKTKMNNAKTPEEKLSVAIDDLYSFEQPESFLRDSFILFRREALSGMPLDERMALCREAFLKRGEMPTTRNQRAAMTSGFFLPLTRLETALILAAAAVNNSQTGKEASGAAVELHFDGLDLDDLYVAVKSALMDNFTNAENNVKLSLILTEKLAEMGDSTHAEAFGYEVN